MVITALQQPVYKPAMRAITAITQAEIATITTSFDHSYISGTIVRIIVPEEFGMTQINQLSGTITVINTTQFTIPINTLYFDAFVYPVAPVQVAQVVPFGEITELLEAAVVNVLPYT